MNNPKLTGSFYTPTLIADFLVDHIAKRINVDYLEILEPSAGDGVFIQSIYDHELLSTKIKNVVAVEREEKELDKVKGITKSPSLGTLHLDFLEYQKDNARKFDLVIGNPPYIKKKLLSAEQIALCEDIHIIYPDLSKKKINNIWSAFLVRCINFLKEDGILAFVLPSELLQVKFAAELRALILKEFEHVEIFTFNELLFKDCKGQDTILLVGERKSEKKGIYYSNIKNIDNLEKKEFKLKRNIKIKESKWTHHHLNSGEIRLLEMLKNKLQTVNYYCISKPGIVTAANNFFIVNSATLKKYSLQRFVKPIIQKGSFVNGSVILTKDDFNELKEQLKPTFLLDLNNRTKLSANEKLNEYLNQGVELKIHERYKTSLRKRWYEIPNISTPPQAFFFKRCNEYPKIIKNDADVLATDSAYKIQMYDDYKIENFIYSFYNSLTLSFAELYGRYYGGGVLELTPNEFKILPVPYIDVNNKDFNSFVVNFKNKSSIKEICKNNDQRILKSIDNSLDDKSINKIFEIREKLYLHRIKTN